MKNNKIHKDGVTIHIVRSQRRKTISIQVRQAEVSIHVPYSLALAEIDAIIAKKMRWIREKIQRQQLQDTVPKRTYTSGEWFDYLGGKYQLSITYGTNKNQITLIEQTINLQLISPKANIKEILAAWYQQQADIYLRQRTKHYALMIGVQPTAIIVKTYKARWGSCYSDGRISFNWKLIMAATWVIDYVVVHELCHLIHHNHSANFWRLVEQYYPSYKQAKEWLKQNGQLLKL